MAVELVIEDGSIVAGANTYVDLAKARELASCRGLALPADDELLTQYLIRAMDYLEARRCDFQGEKADINQALQFPRKGLTYECREIEPPENGDPWFMPSELAKAQVQLAVKIKEGVPLYSQDPTTDSNFESGPIVQETIGPLTVKYSDRHLNSGGGRSSSSNDLNVIPAVESLLNPLLKTACDSGSGSYFETVRV